MKMRKTRINKIIAIVVATVVAISPLTVFAEQDICYDNPISYDEDYEPIAFGPHSWTYSYTENADCTNKGCKYYYCEHCLEEKEVEIPAKGHKWSKTQMVDDPNNWMGLIWGKECKRTGCDAVKYVPLKIKQNKKKALWKGKSWKKIKKMSGNKIIFKSSNKKVAKVNKRGVIRAKRRGESTIKAKIYYKKYKLWITVKCKVVVR